RQAHNLKAAGSNPAPASKHQAADSKQESAAFCCTQKPPQNSAQLPYSYQMKVKMSVDGAIRGQSARSFDEAPEAQLAAMGLLDLLPVADMVGQGTTVGTGGFQFDLIAAHRFGNGLSVPAHQASTA
ncbi:MAG: hypothetical protein ACOVN0_00765, partial [Niveispirillum sp.]|uniref:hypothetical protein n=1 Tax=Niveispirillum sp. TaxID=1917217 RepID=UPI003BA5DAC7